MRNEAMRENRGWKGHSLTLMPVAEDMSATSPRPSPPFINGGEGGKPVMRSRGGGRAALVPYGAAATRGRVNIGLFAGRQPAVGICTKIGGNWPDVAGEAAIIVKPSARNGEQGGVGKFSLLMSKVPHH